eukprot:gene12372-3637_t
MELREGLNVDGSDTLGYRYKMPALEMKIEKRKTILCNLEKISKCQGINRNAE